MESSSRGDESQDIIYSIEHAIEEVTHPGLAAAVVISHRNDSLRTSATTPISRLVSTWGTRPKKCWTENTQDPLLQSYGYPDSDIHHPTSYIQILSLPEKYGAFRYSKLTYPFEAYGDLTDDHPMAVARPDFPGRPHLCGLLVLAAGGLSSGRPSTSAETDGSWGR